MNNINDTKKFLAPGADGRHTIYAVSIAKKSNPALLEQRNLIADEVDGRIHVFDAKGLPILAGMMPHGIMEEAAKALLSPVTHILITVRDRGITAEGYTSSRAAEIDMIHQLKAELQKHQPLTNWTEEALDNELYSKSVVSIADIDFGLWIHEDEGIITAYSNLDDACKVDWKIISV